MREAVNVKGNPFFWPMTAWLVIGTAISLTVAFTTHIPGLGLVAYIPYVIFYVLFLKWNRRKD